MEGKPPETTAWVLTHPTFAQLLQWLDPDEEQAGEKYERLQQKLRLFFEHRGCRHSEELTDQTLDRVAHKLDSDEGIRSADPASYCYGVAHNILKEYWRESAREAVPLDSQPDKGNLHINAAMKQTPEDEIEETEINLGHLNFCLRQLPPPDRELILAYYKGEHRDRINNRQELAQRLDISPGSLRIRALRIREQLHTCINRCKKCGTSDQLDL